MLVANNADLQNRNKDGKTALDYCNMKGFTEIADALTAAIKNEEEENVANGDTRSSKTIGSVFHNAVKAKDKRKVLQLLPTMEAGIINEVDGEGFTSLFHAALSGDNQPTTKTRG